MRPVHTVPPTLRDLAGIRPEPPSWRGASLVVIDAQQEYATGALRLPGLVEPRQALARLLDAARGHGAPVVHVWHEGGRGGAFDPDGAGFAPLEEAAPYPGEAMVRKRMPDGFVGTDLAEILRAEGRGTVIVAGFMTHMCVDSTIRSAVHRGLSCVVVADACASRDLPSPTGGVIPAERMHAAALAALADRFATVVSDADAILP